MKTKKVIVLLLLGSCAIAGVLWYSIRPEQSSLQTIDRARGFLARMETSVLNEMTPCKESKAIQQEIEKAHAVGMQLLIEARKEAQRFYPDWNRVLDLLELRLDAREIEDQHVERCVSLKQERGRDM